MFVEQSVHDLFFQRLIWPAGLLEGLKPEENQFLTNKEKHQQMWKHLQSATDTGQSHRVMNTTFRTYRSHKGGFHDRQNLYFDRHYSHQHAALYLIKRFLYVYTCSASKLCMLKKDSAEFQPYLVLIFGTKLLHDKGAAVVVQQRDSKTKILSWSTLKCLG